MREVSSRSAGGGTGATAGSSVVTAREVTLKANESAAFLLAMSTSDEKVLKSLPGMPPDAATRILAYRKGGKSFSSLSQVREVLGLSSEEFDGVLKRFKEFAFSPEDPTGGGPLSANSNPSTPSNADRGRRGAAGAAQKGQPGTPNAPPPAAGGSGLDLEVKAGYYSMLPGYDLEKLDPDKRKRFLDTINREKCSCGCTDDTLGSCLVNDPGCPVVKARVKKLYTDVFGSPPPASAGSTAAH